MHAPFQCGAFPKAVAGQGVPFLEASISMIPKNTVEVTEENVAVALLKLLENLEDHDDVQKVHANFDLDAELMEKLS
ncbi:MAG: YebC/PmpR family DNA-binding transcriptional regulator [Desulfobacterales bacterium]